MSQEKKQLTLDQQEKLKIILQEAVILATKFEAMTDDTPDGVYFTAVAILAKTAKEQPGYNIAEQLVDSLTDFMKKVTTN